jgi:hypothetical protein
MRSISFHVPQAKKQILLYKFPAQASLMVDPASPRAPNDIYCYLMVEFWRALRYTALLSLSRLRDVQRFLVEKEMWVLSFPANSSPEFKTHARSWIENVKPGNWLLFFRNNLVPDYYGKLIIFHNNLQPRISPGEIKYHRLLLDWRLLRRS